MGESAFIELIYTVTMSPQTLLSCARSIDSLISNSCELIPRVPRVRCWQGMNADTLGGGPEHGQTLGKAPECSPWTVLGRQERLKPLEVHPDNPILSNSQGDQKPWFTSIWDGIAFNNVFFYLY